MKLHRTRAQKGQMRNVSKSAETFFSYIVAHKMQRTERKD
jgi:hypothetical protein